MRLFAAVFAVALASAISHAEASVVIEIDKTTQQMQVSVDGAPRWTWPVSTGRSGYATPSGSFRAFRLEEDHYSKEWDDAPMPHSIFFTEKGHAIHGSYETRRIGTPASHGCVRLAPDNAAKLFALVRERGVTNAKVVLTGSETLFAKHNARQPTTTARRPAQEGEMDRNYYASRGGQYAVREYDARPPAAYPPPPYGYRYYQVRPDPYYRAPPPYPYPQYRQSRGPFPFFWD